MDGVWLVLEAGPAWMEGRVEVPFWIPGVVLGVVIAAALVRLALRATAPGEREQ
jgi:hypothetical protein